MEGSTFRSSEEEDVDERVFYCPECSIEYEPLPVSNFPKNLYLLNLNKDKDEEEAGPVKRTSAYVKGSTPDKSQRSIDEDNVLCSFHPKKIEAYCMLCKQVLCIDCILNDGHKNHEINAIEKAVGIERNLFYDFLKRAMEIEDRIKAQNLEIDNHFLMVRNQANKNRDALSKIFNNVRKLINERENELKSKIASVLNEEEDYLNDKKEQLNDQLITIANFKKQSRVIDSDNSIKILQNSNDLYKCSQKALEKHCSVTLKDPFVNVKEDIELMHICKLINPGYSGTSNSKALRGSKYSSGGYKASNGRARSKDGRSDALKSNNLLKKNSWNNPVVGVNKPFGQSPNKKTKESENNVARVTHTDNEMPNYSKPIHNKRKNKQNNIGNSMEIRFVYQFL